MMRVVASSPAADEWYNIYRNDILFDRVARYGGDLIPTAEKDGTTRRRGVEEELQRDRERDTTADGLSNSAHADDDARSAHVREKCIIG